MAEPAPGGLRRGPAAFSLFLLACVVAGAVTGLVWELVTPLSRVQRVGDQVLSTDVEQESAVAADGWFTVCTAVAGVISAVAVYARVRGARIGALAAVTIGGLLAAVIAWRLGVALGPGSVADEAAGRSDGEIFSGPLRLSAVGVLLTWPLTAVITYFALAAGLDPDRPGRAASSTAAASPGGARLPPSMPPGADDCLSGATG